jgi:3,4-dihydroxy 2-butanone 4-phosphate synthase/GTP cyclohydrolase II
METERHVARGRSQLPTRHGEFRMIAFESQLDGESHVALVKGDVERATSPVLVRMHAHCLAGDVFGGVCAIAGGLDHSLEMIASEGTGALIYLHQTSKGFNVDDSAGVSP